MIFLNILPVVIFFIDGYDAKLFKKYLYYNYDITKFILFKLDINKVSNELYSDPNIHNAVITKDNVSSDTIIDYKILNYNKDLY